VEPSKPIIPKDIVAEENSIKPPYYGKGLIKPHFGDQKSAKVLTARSTQHLANQRSTGNISTTASSGKLSANTTGTASKVQRTKSSGAKKVKINDDGFSMLERAISDTNGYTCVEEVQITYVE